MLKDNEKGFLQGLKPIHSRSIRPGLKPRPPKEKELLSGPPGRRRYREWGRAEAERFLGMPLGWQSRHLTK